VITKILYRLTEGRSEEITVRSTAVITSESLGSKLLGDFNDSGKVDLLDFFIFASAFGTEAQAKLLALAEQYLGLPIQPVLAQSFPNPFNSETTISFSLPVPTMVSLTVYNMAGQQIGILVDDEYRSAGTHQTTWNANRL
jgi:hypothetical protein